MCLRFYSTLKTTQRQNSGKDGVIIISTKWQDIHDNDVICCYKNNNDDNNGNDNSIRNNNNNIDNVYCSDIEAYALIDAT